MTNQNKGVYWIIAVVIIILIILGLYKVNDSSNSGPIRIGFISPLTGDAVAYGEPVKKGVEIAVSEINNNGGVNGRQIEVIYEDGKCSNKDATSATQKLISIDKVKVIVGMICSGELLSAAPIAESSQVILLGQGSSPDITNAGDYTFRTFPSDKIVSSAMLDHMSKNNVKTIAILSGSTAFTTALKKDIELKIKDTKITIVALEDYVDNTKDYRSLLQKIKLTNPDAIILNTQTGSDGGLAAQQARSLGIKSQFYTAYFSGPEFVELGSAVEGTLVIDAPALDSENQAVSAFLQKSKDLYGTEPTYPFFSANARDQIYLLANIFSDTDPNDSLKIKEALYKTKDFDGLSGKFGFDNNGDVVGIGMRIMQVKDGKLVPVK